MMAPRAFLFVSASPQKPLDCHGTKPITPFRSGYRPTSISESRSSNTTPVVIPPKRGSQTMSTRREGRSRARSKTSEVSRRSTSSSSNDRRIPTSFNLMLDATAIPPRRSWNTRRPRKLAHGNHQEEFRRMLQEDVQPKRKSSDGSIHSPLGFLLSPPEDHDKPLGIDSEHGSPLSVRSTSSESTPSLVHGLASPSSFSLSTPPSPRAIPERRQPRYSHCEECAFDHPLLHTGCDDFDDAVETSYNKQPMEADITPAKRSTSFGRLATFKSNLTASLRVIKSAAQTVSTFATPSMQPEDFLTRSLFAIAPETTDDRRPLPMEETPSPALRRYLNPTPMSPAEMYVYKDHRHDTLKASTLCPVSIQMQTYRRSSGRGNRRNHFHIANRDQKFVTYDPEVPSMARSREIRENSDFLRVVVLEMNMRRCGKLREDIPTRARVWLPARKNNYRLSGLYEDGDDDNAVPSRWVGISA